MTDQEEMLQNWEDTFTRHSSSCWVRCECGTQYYNSDGSWDWDEGELDGLRADANAFDVDYGISIIAFNGKEFANPCDCWKPVALRVIGFLDSHMDGLREFIEKERLRRLAAKKADSFVLGLDTPPKPQGKRKILLED